MAGATNQKDLNGELGTSVGTDPSPLERFVSYNPIELDVAYTLAGMGTDGDPASGPASGPQLGPAAAQPQVQKQAQPTNTGSTAAPAAATALGSTEAQGTPVGPVVDPAPTTAPRPKRQRKQRQRKQPQRKQPQPPSRTSGRIQAKYNGQFNYWPRCSGG
ncbi:hypothetical protein TWF106_004853 [Orbilia oligospora]|uniref:Uncharacterized protein n=1 Tax=Orbilia oligospora TaxID=2813651 RepID=A0A7C8V2W9_ORBOL|nr:hypothetical protein TWF106_004853 [Orbilia oligospora]